ncbi:MAG: hypothetical protein EOO47_11715 [Flavobacterium sp.]|nr:MAG: hypothetical protein EOO47_11715 [Flavobacterium sp.]
MKTLKISALLILIGFATATMAQKKVNEQNDDEPCVLPKYKPGQTSAEINAETREYIRCKQTKEKRQKDKKLRLKKQQDTENEQKRRDQEQDKQRRQEEVRLANETNRQRQPNNTTPRPTPQRHDPQKEAAQRAREERIRLNRERASEERRKKREAEGN